VQNFSESLYNLIVKTSTELPGDVLKSLEQAFRKENEGIRSKIALDTIESNIDMARNNIGPICQDTGMPTFKIKVPVGTNEITIKKQIYACIEQATKNGILRPNSVDSLTGKNSGNNIGPGVPVIKFEQWEKDYIEVSLILKGGGCENKNIQYSLPTELEGLGKAGRDLDGIRKCILHSVYQAQGQGCSAGFIGVGIGGDRATGYELAKTQLFRDIDDVNDINELATLEDYILENANKLGIGTMGFGGETTLLGCKIGVQDRLPASFFVSVAYNCWAFRRQAIKICPDSGNIISWYYENKNNSSKSTTSKETQQNVINLTPPLSEEKVRSLKVGDVVKISGDIFTGRDSIHKYFYENKVNKKLDGHIIYHCGPVMLKDDENKWHVKAAGPTTSIREEPYQAEVMKKYGIRAVIGKGGMGKKTLEGLKDFGGVYLNAIGGAAQFYSEAVTSVKGVDFLDFGIPEAMWHLEVNEFMAVVTMDSHGNSLHADVEASSLEKLKQFSGKVF
jgi:fumarate hydratase class I